MKTLRSVLEQATQDLKADFIIQTKVWAKAEFDLLMKRSTWRDLDWCSYFGLKPRLVNSHVKPAIEYSPDYKLGHMEFWGMPDNFYNTRDARRLDSIKNEIRRAKSKGEEGFIQTQVEKAERHYNDSLDKLVYRLVRKGIDKNRGSEVTVKKARVGVNLEMVISIDDIQVRAWTIIAEGVVQRPHYRYLVK